MNNDLTTRVQIPAYHDYWMRGDRYGNIVRISKRKYTTQQDYIGKTTYEREIAHVLLDQSNKVVRVLLADCEVL